jgi:arylsulfatase
MAVTRHSVPWMFGAVFPPLDEDVWELYDTTTDWTQAHDLAADHPEKVTHLQRLFLIGAVKHQVLPLVNRRVERLNSDLAGRPSLITGPSQLIFGGMGEFVDWQERLGHADDGSHQGCGPTRPPPRTSRQDQQSLPG